MTKCLRLTTVGTSPQFAGLHTNLSCVGGWPGAACSKLLLESRICGQRCGSILKSRSYIFANKRDQQAPTLIPRKVMERLDLRSGAHGVTKVERDCLESAVGAAIKRCSTRVNPERNFHCPSTESSFAWAKAYVADRPS